MSSEVQLVIVSAFGRGNWLAAELSKAGIKTCLVDVTDSFGRWSPEDSEGPFGFFQSENILESQVTRLHEEDYFESIPEGFVVWTGSGVLDTSGPISNELLEKWQVDKDQQDYLRHFSTSKGGDVSQIKKRFAHKSFKSNWFTQLCHSLAAPSFNESSFALRFGEPLPVFSPHFLRRTSRRGYEQNLKWVESWGSRVLSKAKLVDLNWQSRFVQGLEVSSDWSGVLTAEQYVWCLTAEETEYLSVDIRNKIFPKSSLRPQWQWQRYRVQIRGEKNQIHQQMPLQVVCIEDMGLPWTHENLFILQRSVTAEDYDLWMRLPSSQRFHRSYIEEKGEKAIRNLGRRLPGCDVKISQWPTECEYDYQALGPSRFPVYSSEDLQNQTRNSWINLHFDSPETWPRLDWSGQLLAQQKIRNLVLDWKEERERERLKQEQRNQRGTQA